MKSEEKLKLYKKLVPMFDKINKYKYWSLPEREDFFQKIERWFYNILVK